MKARWGWRDVVPEAVLAVVVLGVGLREASYVADQARFYGRGLPPPDEGHLDVLVVLVALAVGLCRRLPSLSLLVMAVAGIVHVDSSLPFLFVEVGFCAAMFGAARWGQPVTAWLALALAAVGAVTGLSAISPDYFNEVFNFLPGTVVSNIYGSSLTWRAIAAMAGGVLILVPWLLGLVLRLFDRNRAERHAAEQAALTAERARRDAEQAQQIAVLEEERAQLAHDVHDVVGHSLAVILAQAESGRYADDSETLKQTMATIASAARTSLQDVRQVLRTGEARRGSLTELVEGVRASGHEVVEKITGVPRPLPPDLEAVAYRVLQEMLTNALHHGRRDAALTVEQRWADGLMLRVSNPAEIAADPGEGQGLVGMRRRLASVGGTLDVTPGDPFVVAATLPLRREGR